MYEHTAIFVKPFSKQKAFQVRTVTFEASDSDFSISVLSLIRDNYDKFAHCYVIEANTLAPLYFDYTLNGLRNKMFFTCAQAFEQIAQDKVTVGYVKHSDPSCKISHRNSGYAGQFFMQDVYFASTRTNPRKPFEEGIFNCPEKFYNNN